MQIETPGRLLKIVLHTLASEPGSAYQYMKSLLPGYDSVKARIPYMPYKATAWLESYLKPDMSVFEYGSGGSTLFLAKRVGRLVSIEHDAGWHSRISSLISEMEITNCEYVLREPEQASARAVASASNHQRYTSSAGNFEGLSFQAYVEWIDRYPDRSFDLVIVDGRARAACVSHSIAKVRSGGYLLLDDSERQRYADAVDMLSGFERTDFLGAAPRSILLQQTSVWKIEHDRA
ncbi:MAG: class I SAM-dependent methyltransferase [Chloroflexi bacterium]|nr:class I SAM-dependent methyltransferase [Chloroflexota bacterium]